MKLRATQTDLLDTLVAEQAAQVEGERNTELFRRTRVALEAGSDSDDVAARMTAAGIAGGLAAREAASTVASALREPVDRPAAGTPSVPASDWEAVWLRTWPRVIGIGKDKVPRQPWQYSWDGANAITVGGTPYLAIVIPPGLAVLDVDDGELWLTNGLEVPAGAPQYPSISGKPGKGHVWFRLHTDRPYPTRKMKAWPGADRLIGGLGVANVKDWETIRALPLPVDMPLAPDWFQPPREPSRGVRNIVDYLRDVPVDIPWVIGKMAYTHGMTLIAGSPKAGKSTLAFELMRCLENGEYFLGQTVYEKPALLVTEEGGVSVRFKGEDLVALDVYDRKASAGESFEETLAVIGEWSSLHPGGVVFIDTLAAWAQVEDENASSEMQEAIDSIRLSISEPYEVAVILIHHARKGGGKHGEGIRGSGAILAAVDHVVELSRADEKHPNRRIIDIMSRVLHTGERWLVDWDGDTRRYTVVTDEVAEYEAYEDLEADVAGIPSTGEGVTVKGTGLSWRRLAKLVSQGRVRKVEGVGNKPALYWGIPPVGMMTEAADDDD